ncbi:tRNA 2-thiouridine(34) synthase MnmA [Candidatus Berkelbacteria bacterium]|nr:tRNA 2-thiouridine(34) synthase MnmA [Candidatus Berkelbacteria bacterium]
MNKKRVFMAMSGGVDSSVSAALLKKQGYEVVGVFMRNWSDDSVTCPWAQDQYDARRVAEILKIPFYTFNFEEEYKKTVVDYFFREYQAGRTPNPDVMCNKTIKFGRFLEEARKLGADYIATGHYARLRREFPISNFQFPNKFQISNSKPIYKLLRGADKNKDQSYFLWTLTQKQLKHTLFPIGDLTKPHVRYLAKKFHLPNAEKKDSQGICFIGPINVREFLKTKIKQRQGKVIDLEGKEIGKHEGVWFYTIGQRHGFGGGGGLPLYVVGKETKKNILIVGTEDEPRLYSSELSAEKSNWVNSSYQTKKSFKCRAQVRYRQAPFFCQVLKSGIKIKVKFEKPLRALTPGQSMVFYKGQELIGGAVISD